jgi:1-deoxy-D-xylulose-5-phosphate synthase
MIIYSPLSEIGLQNYYTAQLGLDHPIAIRYPRGRGVLPDWQTKNFGNYEKDEIGRAHCLKHGTETAVLSNGPIGKNVTLALANLNNQQQLPIMILHSLNPGRKELHSVLKLSKRL